MTLEWQPIETAPKDGKRVRLYYPDYVETDRALGYEAPGQVEGYYAGSDEYGCWVTPCRTASDDPEPTHWMPLPDAPEGAE